MEPARIERRLAAILAADVAGGYFAKSISFDELRIDNYDNACYINNASNG